MTKPHVYRLNRKIVSERTFLRGAKGITPGKPPACTPPSCYPMTSRSLAVRTWQKQEAEKRAAELGVPTRYKIVGDSARPQFDSKQHRKRFCEIKQVGDLDAGYSDPIPPQRRE